LIVVDTQILVYLTLAGEYTTVAESVLERDSEWVAPPLWRSEMRNVLAGYLRRGTIDAAAALAIIDEAAGILSAEIAPPDELIFRQVTATRCSAYDLEFVALAEHLDVPLVTNDKEILAAFPRRSVAPVAFAAN